MKKRCISAGLALVLLLAVPPSAARAEEALPGTLVIPPGAAVEVDPEAPPAEEHDDQPSTPASLPRIFQDVPPDAWYALPVNLAAVRGLVKGVGEDTFLPMGTVTLGQVVVLTARLHADFHHQTVNEDTSGPWYLPAYNYCISQGIFTAVEHPAATMNHVATRFELVELWDKAIPEAQMTPVNPVSSWDFSDLSEFSPHGEVVYKWFRAGIVQGSDGKFSGDRELTRAEMAAILCRLSGDMPRIIRRF